MTNDICDRAMEAAKELRDHICHMGCEGPHVKATLLEELAAMIAAQRKALLRQRDFVDSGVAIFARRSDTQDMYEHLVSLTISLDDALASGAGANLLNRLDAAEKMCERILSSDEWQDSVPLSRLLMEWRHQNPPGPPAVGGREP